MKIKILFILTLLIFSISLCMAKQNIWNMEELKKAPKVYEYNTPLYKDKSWSYNGILKTEELRNIDKNNNYVKSIQYKGVDYNGRETRVFAFIGIPPVEKGKKIPAIVLVHGGGGGAFEAWVRLWNAKGYAAIAMDTCGAESINEYTGKTAPWGCNSSWGDFGNIDKPIKDQWTYQAVSAVILANSLLRSYPEIDKNNIGITGVSWGGYLTCIASSIDNRFKFAIPIYGCGYLKDSSAWIQVFKDMKDGGEKWLSLWDPSVYLKDRTVPIHWIAGNTDAAYWILSLKKSYDCVPGNKYLHIKENLPHDHGANGESQEETFAIANDYVYGTKLMSKITREKYENNTLTFNTTKGIKKSILYYTSDTNPNNNSKWTSEEVKVNDFSVTVKIPDSANVFFVNVFNDKGLITSTDVYEKNTK